MKGRSTRLAGATVACVILGAVFAASAMAATIIGTRHHDRLWALAKADVTGPGDSSGDTLHGGAGNDKFRTRDGEQDKIDCGDGFDRVLADPEDVIVDATPGNLNGSCERVVRAEPNSTDQNEENKFQSPREDNRTH